MGSTPSSGRRSFITVKIDFLISPAYQVPPISTSVRDGCRQMKVSLRVPSSAGSAVTAGACRISASGLCVASSTSVGSMKSVFAKSACHALSVTTRTAMRCFGSAPAKASTT